MDVCRRLLEIMLLGYKDKSEIIHCNINETYHEDIKHSFCSALSIQERKNSLAWLDIMILLGTPEMYQGKECTSSNIQFISLGQMKAK
jgi:hypothetical protein